MESLQDGCLKQIMGNLDTFSALYAQCQGTPYARLFEFLRRVYSNKIFSRMVEFEEEHLDMLLSPHLKNLDIRHVSKDFIRSLANRLKVQGNGLETIKARFSKLLYEELIPSSSHLVDIEIGGFRHTRPPRIDGIYTSELIKSLGKHCPLLRVLKLRDDEDGGPPDQRLLTQGLKFCPKLYEAVSYLLDNCPSLEILENVDTIKILYIKHKQELIRNDLENCRKYSLIKLSFVNGERFPFHYENYSGPDALKICSAVCPKVTCIELCSINGNELVRCADFKALQNVKIVFAANTVSDMNQFLTIRGRTLVNLELYNPSISVPTLINCCPELEHMTLCSVSKFAPLKPEEYSLSMPGLPKLKSLFIAWSCFSWYEIREGFQLIISVAKNLEIVHFRSVSYTNEFFKSIFELGFHRIRELDVHRTDIPLSFLIKLLTQGNLRNLNVWDCNSVDSSYARDTLYGIKRDNQTVKVKCLEDMSQESFYTRHPHDEWDFPDLYGEGDYDSDLDCYSNNDLGA